MRQRRDNQEKKKGSSFLVLKQEQGSNKSESEDKREQYSTIEEGSKEIADYLPL